MQCVPDEPGTEIVFESTAKGIGGEFYDRFWGARFRIIVKGLNSDGEPIIEETINESADENNIYTAVFSPLVRIRRLPDAGAFRFGADPRRKRDEGDPRAGRRSDLLAPIPPYSNKCRGRLEEFQQEYPANPMRRLSLPAARFLIT